MRRQAKRSARGCAASTIAAAVAMALIAFNSDFIPAPTCSAATVDGDIALRN